MLGEYMTQILLSCSLFVGAVLYTSVGHAGASAYIAIMALFGVEQAVMKPTALVLNIFVATFASYRFIRAGFIDYRIALYSLLGAIPMAYLGGSIHLDPAIYKPLVGSILVLVAVKFLWPNMKKRDELISHSNLIGLILSGGAIGLLSGLTGTGGGIFLSPLLLLMNWSTVKNASGTASLFILGNSIAGLLGNYSSVQSLPNSLPIYVIAALLGAFVGTKFGISKISSPYLPKVLGLVLLIAGSKMLFVW